MKANLSELNLFIVKFDSRRYFVQRFDQARIERFFELSIFTELTIGFKVKFETIDRGISKDEKRGRKKKKRDGNFRIELEIVHAND